jgi:hypothetical protein
MKLVKHIPIWTLDEVKSSTHCGHTPYIRILDGEETEEELVGELTSFAPLLLVAPPYQDIKEAWNSAITIEHMLAKAGAMDVDIAVPIVAPKRDERVVLAGRCLSHEPPFIIALHEKITNERGQELNRFTQFTHIRHEFTRGTNGFLLLIDFEKDEPITQFFETYPALVWEAIERG